MLDTAHVITTAARPDRLAAFTDRAARAGLSVEVHLGRQDGFVPNTWRGSPQSFYNAEAHATLLAAHTGVSAIFEDDAELPPNTAELIDAALAAAPPDWELILLGARPSNYGEHWRAPLHQVTRFCLTHAYLVSDRGRQIALEAAVSAERHWDHTLSRRLGWRGRTWMLCPPIAQDPALGSDIPDSGRYRR